MRLPNFGRALWLAASSLTAFAVAPAYAQAPAAPPAAAAPAAAPAAEAPPPGFWINGIHLSAQVEGGITANPADPASGVNFGRLFDDRANTPLMNQLLLTANKPLDPKATGFDWGFKLQGMFGTDARYTHFTGIFDNHNSADSRYQFDIVEANALFHLPVLTEGGIDIKAGLYSTPIGYETIDPSTNPFYSHSYIFNFGIPLKHLGVLTTTHINPLIDFYLGIDTGVNTTIGCCLADNNHSPGGIIGFGLNMMDGNLTVLALTHIGPENAVNALSPVFNADKYMRYLSDIVVTWKATPKLTLVAELNWIRDEFLGFSGGAPGVANGFGAAGYVSYALSDAVALNARAEIFRDDKGAFVFGFPGRNDFVRSELGLFNSSFGTGVPTTYGEFTIGATIKPTLPAPVTGLMIRPEFRYDTTLNGVKAFKDGTRTGNVTFAADFVLTF